VSLSHGMMTHHLGTTFGDKILGSRAFPFYGAKYQASLFKYKTFH
jgi:hypothetical protein